MNETDEIRDEFSESCFALGHDVIVDIADKTGDVDLRSVQPVSTGGRAGRTDAGELFGARARLAPLRAHGHGRFRRRAEGHVRPARGDPAHQ